MYTQPKAQALGINHEHFLHVVIYNTVRHKTNYNDCTLLFDKWVQIEVKTPGDTNRLYQGWL